MALLYCAVGWYVVHDCDISWSYAFTFLLLYWAIYFQNILISILAIYIENTRWVCFHIKFTRQGFENACWHREACRAIQQAFSNPSLVNSISKDANLVFYLSVYPLLNTLQTSDYDVIMMFVLIQRHKRRHSKKVQRHHDLIKVTCREIENVY